MTGGEEALSEGPFMTPSARFMTASRRMYTDGAVRSSHSESFHRVPTPTDAAAGPNGPSNSRDDDPSGDSDRSRAAERPRGGDGMTGSPNASKRYDWDEVSPSVAVIETVASIDERSVTALPPLSRSVDPDALDELVRSGATTTAPTTANDRIVVSFRYARYEIVVTGAGTVTVDEDRA